VFDLEGGFVRGWGSEGTAEGEFEFPVRVCVDGTHVLVSDCNNDRLQMFDLEGRFLQALGSEGTGEGQFNGPCGIAVWDDRLYVADRDNSRVQVFDWNPPCTCDRERGVLGGLED
jgi:DNA-binding beta-propeller fold protein YncE